MIDFGYGIQLDTLDKAPQARDWRNQKAIYNNCRQVGLISESNQKKWLETGDVQNMFAIFGQDVQCEIKAGGYIGVAGLTSIHPTHRTAEISLYIALEYQSTVVKGTSGAIIKTLAAYAFEDMNLNRIFGETFATNTIELLNLQELGFVTEGTLRQTYYKNGQYIDSVIQSLLRSDYDKLKDGWK
jgi:RimJ/RimL family protein N-acetyltransferase